MTPVKSTTQFPSSQAGAFQNKSYDRISVRFDSHQIRAFCSVS